MTVLFSIKKKTHHILGVLGGMRSCHFHCFQWGKIIKVGKVVSDKSRRISSQNCRWLDVVFLFSINSRQNVR